MKTNQYLSTIILPRVRFWLALFTTGLLLSGITAFPLVWELEQLSRFYEFMPYRLEMWLANVLAALQDIQAQHGFIFYGTDWLAFAHIIIAAAFIGPIIDPVKNKWVIQWGLLGCAMVIPMALIAGEIRDIPFWWRLVDCSFGIIGAMPLLTALVLLKRLEKNAYQGFDAQKNLPFNFEIQSTRFHQIPLLLLGCAYEMMDCVREAVFIVLFRTGEAAMDAFSKPERWPYTMEEMRRFPEGSFAREIAAYLDEHNYVPFEKYASHDINHILLEYDMDMRGEIMLQYFMLGNGHVSPAALCVTLYGLLMPEFWGDFKRAFDRGSRAPEISSWQFDKLMHLPAEQVRDMLVQPIYQLQ